MLSIWEALCNTWTSGRDSPCTNNPAEVTTRIAFFSMVAGIAVETSFTCFLHDIPIPALKIAYWLSMSRMRLYSSLLFLSACVWQRSLLAKCYL